MVNDLTAQSKEYLSALYAQPQFHALLKELQELDIFAEKVFKRWTPDNNLSEKERIYYDGLHEGRNEVLSIFRGN